MRNKLNNKILLWLGVFAAVFIWSAISPKDRFTWIPEVSPAIIGLIVIVTTYHTFRRTPLAKQMRRSDVIE